MPHKDPAAAKAYHKNYRAVKSAAVKAAQKRCYVAKSEYYKAKARNWYASNKDHAAVRSKMWREENKDSLQKKAFSYREKNADHLRQKDCEDYRSPSGLNSVLKRYFGITLDQYNAMLTAQGGVCAICHSKHKTMRLSVDHCHKTGKVRGLLCGRCNTGIGMLSDSIELVTAAKKYLELYEQPR